MVISSCKEESLQDKIARMGVENFSVSRYIYDQWRGYHNMPFTILKTVNENGKIDSTYTNSQEIDWREIFGVFMETDISDHELTGRYKYSQFEDREDNSMSYYYEAIDDKNFASHLFDKYQDLITRKLLITTNPYTNYITGIYIETFEHSMFTGDVKQKLFFSPTARIIQIQRYVSPLIGKKKSIITQYFLQH